MKLLVIGYGKMGSAIVECWNNDEIFSDIIAIDPSAINQNKGQNENNNIIIIKSCNDLGDNYHPDVILIAIKPQDATKENLSFYSKFPNAIFISIMAGKDIGTMSNIFGKDAKIARVMPNLCAKIAQSTSMLSYSNSIINNDKELVLKLVSSFGSYTEISEDMFHSGTVITGCAPAYFYSMCSMLIENAISFGFSEKDSKQMVKEVFISSANFFDNIKDGNFRDTINAISSKGGVTEAILKNLEPQMKESIKESLLIGIGKSKAL